MVPMITSASCLLLSLSVSLASSLPKGSSDAREAHFGSKAAAPVETQLERFAHALAGDIESASDQADPFWTGSLLSRSSAPFGKVQITYAATDEQLAKMNSDAEAEDRAAAGLTASMMAKLSKMPKEAGGDMGLIGSSDDARQEVLRKLKGRTVMFRGDSTMRQVLGGFMSLMGGLRGRELRKHIVAHCDVQSHRVHYEAKDHAGFGMAKCGANEFFCKWNFPKHNISVMWDWKHLPVEDRELYLYQSEEARKQDPKHPFHEKMPDVIVVQLGGHPCYHCNKSPRGKSSKLKFERSRSLSSTNKTLEDDFVSSFRDEMFPLKREHTNWHGAVVAMEQGFVNFDHAGDALENCVRRFNGAIREAQKRDPLVFLAHRYELEREWVRANPEDTDYHHHVASVDRVTRSLLATLDKLAPRLPLLV